jgi:hypothetical protein
VALEMDLPWLTGVFCELGSWTYGPLAWTVDMLAWGVSLTGDVLGAIPMITDMLPEGLDLVAVFAKLADGLRDCFEPACNVTYPECP